MSRLKFFVNMGTTSDIERYHTNMCNFNKAKTPHKKQCQAVCLNFTSRATYQYLYYEDNIYYSQNKIAKDSRASSTFKSRSLL